MAVVSEDRAVSPGAVSRTGASARILVLRLVPVVLALVTEPWTAAAVAFDLFRRTPAIRGRAYRQRHVVNASVMLLGIAATIIGVLAITDESARTWSDEVAWIAAAFMLGSIALSCSGTRGGVGRPVQMRMADGAFLAGMAAIVCSLAFAGWQLPR